MKTIYTCDDLSHVTYVYYERITGILWKEHSHPWVSPSFPIQPFGLSAIPIFYDPRGDLYAGSYTHFALDRPFRIRFSSGAKSYMGHVHVVTVYMHRGRRNFIEVVM